MRTSPVARWAGAAAVLLIAGAAAFGFFRPSRMFIGPDAVEHVSIANALAGGHGFVNPVQWYFTLPGPPPLAAAASRAPLMPLLLAASFWLGADLPQAMYIHVLFSTLIIVGLYLVGTRFMRPLFSATAALAIALTGTWKAAAAAPLTEVTAVGAFLLVVATARFAGRSTWGAITCGLATVVAWLARPNLAPLGLAVFVALCVDRFGPRREPWRPLAIYLTVWLGVTSLVSGVSQMLTGHVPYEAYGHSFEHFPATRALRFGLEYVGTIPFVSEHWTLVLKAMTSNAALLGGVLFTMPAFFYAGWWLVLGLVSIGRAPARASVEERVLLLSSLGFCAIIILTYPVIDVRRYPLFPAIGALLVGFAALDRCVRWGQRRWVVLSSRWMAPVSMALLFAVAVSSIAPIWVIPADEVMVAGGLEGPICDVIEPGRMVMTDDPWTTHWECGNPSIRVPSNFKNAQVRAQVLERFRPVYLVFFRKAWKNWAMRQPNLVLQVPSKPLERAMIFTFFGHDASAASERIRPPICLLDPRRVPCRSAGG